MSHPSQSLRFSYFALFSLCLAALIVIALARHRGCRQVLRRQARDDRRHAGQ